MDSWTSYEESPGNELIHHEKREVRFNLWKVVAFRVNKNRLNRPLIRLFGCQLQTSNCRKWAQQKCRTRYVRKRAGANFIAGILENSKDIRQLFTLWLI